MDYKKPPKTNLFTTVVSIFSPIVYFNINLKKFNKIYQSKLIGFSAYVLHDYEFIKHICIQNSGNYKKNVKYDLLSYVLGNGLFTNNSDTWREQRHKIQPLFNHKIVQKSFPLIYQETIKAFKKQDPKEVVDVSEFMGSLTLNIILNNFLSVNSDEIVSSIRYNIVSATKISNILLRLPFPSYPNWIFNIFVFKKLRHSKNNLDDIVTEIITKARYQDNENLIKSYLNNTNECKDTNEVISQLKDEIITLILAGHETTHNALSWLVYILCINKDVKNKLVNIINEKIKEEKDFNLDNINSLVYLDHVINECLRLYPPVYAIGRKSINSDLKNGIYIPPNKNIILSIYSLHRHPNLWNSPNYFIPERFDNIDFTTLKNKFMPFGIGHRSCIGSHFSILEIKTIVCYMLWKFDIELTTKVVKPLASLTLIPNNKILVRLKNK